MKKSMTLITIVLTVAMIFGMTMPANAATAGALAFAATANLPDFPCAGTSCQVTSLSGPVVGAIAGNAPNGATVCATCTLSEGPAGVTYDEPACVAGEPLQGSASGQIQVNGGTSVGTAKTPLVLNISYIRIGVVAVVTFTGGQLGAAVGVFRSVGPGTGGVDCVSGNGPATVQIIGAGAAVDA